MDNHHLTPRRIYLLQTLHRYRLADNALLRDEVLPNGDTAIIRADMRKLAMAELVRRYQPKIVDPLGGSPAPVFTITVKGASVLAAALDDAKYLLPAETSFADWMGVHHRKSVTRLAWTIDKAVFGKDYVRIPSMHFEDEVVAPKEKEPQKRYFLYEVVSQTPRIVVVPDMAFETDVRGGCKRAWYVEYETGSDSPARVAAKKHKGLAGLAETAGTDPRPIYTRHFPESHDFRVAFFCPSDGWRDALRNEFKDKPCAKYCVFFSTPRVKPETFLHEPLLYTVDRGPLPFLPRPT